MKTLAPAIILASLFWPLLSPPAQAEDGPYYLVEVIVLTHSAGRSDGRETDQLIDFNAFIDPMRQARIAERETGQDARRPGDATAVYGDVESSDRARARETVDALELIDAMDSLAAGSETETGAEAAAVGPTYPDRFINQDKLSPTMQSAWNRLASSGEFQPRVWRAWYQPLSRTRLSPQVRIHDNFPLRLDLADLPLPGIPRSQQSRTAEQLVPKADYRLDGGLRLRQRQFMHVELDLVWREAIEQDLMPDGPWAQDQLPPAGFRQHRLTQSRTVRPDRLEYFDSNWLGVLVRIQRWVPPEAEQPGGNGPG